MSASDTTSEVPDMSHTMTTGQPRKGLKKNQACLQCRRGKMKCDAAQPHCTNCIKAWELLSETPNYTGGEPVPDHPICDYDPVEGLIFTPESIADPTARAKAIQDYIDLLSGKLQDAREELQNKRRPAHSRTQSSTLKRRRAEGEMDPDSGERPATRIRTEVTSPDGSTFVVVPPHGPSDQSTGAGSSQIGRRPSLSRLPTEIPPQVTPAPDVPPLDLMKRLLDLFINNEPHSSRIFHTRTLKGTILSHYAPVHPTSSTALLHAISAAAARFIPAVDKRSSSAPTVGSSREGSETPVPPSAPVLPEGFAQSHALRARILINQALADHQDSHSIEQGLASPPSSPDDAFATLPDEDPEDRKQRIRSIRNANLLKDMIQPMIVLTTYYYHEGLGAEVWADVGIIGRALLSMGVLEESVEPSIADEERRRALFSTFILDRLLSTDRWAHCMAEEDSVQRFGGYKPPLSVKALNELGLPNLQVPTPRSEPDSFSLLLDAAVLLGRVNDFRSRARLRHRPLAPFSTVTPAKDASFSASLSEDPTLRWEFNQQCASLNAGVGYWESKGITGRCLQKKNLPSKFKYPIGVTDSFDDTGMDVTTAPRKGRVDTDLFLAHMVHYTTILLLNFPVASFDPPPRSATPSSQTPTSAGSRHDAADIPETMFPVAPTEFPRTLDTTAMLHETCVNNSRSACLNAARSVVDALSLILATNFDISNLHPFVATTWYVSAAVLSYEHQRCGDVGNVIGQRTAAKDVRVLRLSLLKYGSRSPLGILHERQLTALQERISTRPSTGPLPQSNFLPVFPFETEAVETPDDQAASSTTSLYSSRR